MSSALPGFWRRALRQRSFVIGALLTGLLLATAALSLLWTPWPPYDMAMDATLQRPGARHWLGYQDKVQQGLLEHKLNTYQKGDGSEGLSEQVRILPKGITKLAQSLSIGGVQ